MPLHIFPHLRVHCRPSFSAYPNSAAGLLGANWPLSQESGKVLHITKNFCHEKGIYIAKLRADNRRRRVSKAGQRIAEELIGWIGITLAETLCPTVCQFFVQYQIVLMKTGRSHTGGIVALDGQVWPKEAHVLLSFAIKKFNKQIFYARRLIKAFVLTNYW